MFPPTTRLPHAPGEPLTTNIIRSGVSGSYSYSVASDWANRPVGGLSWADAGGYLRTGCTMGSQAVLKTPARPRTACNTLNGATTNPQLQHRANRVRRGPFRRIRVVQGRVPQEQRQHGMLLGFSYEGRFLLPGVGVAQQ